MGDKRKVLLQIDTDPHASSFDSLVAIDAGADVILPYDNVHEEQVVDLIHGAMFTRGLDDLCRTAAFFGGSNYELAEKLYQRSLRAFFGPVRISLMLDPNGANTTAVAAIRAVESHGKLDGSVVAILGGTGPVGTRLASLASHLGARVKLFSRSKQRAEQTAAALPDFAQRELVEPLEIPAEEKRLEILQGTDILLSAGGAGIQLLSHDWLAAATELKVAVDLNAVPPAGLPGLEPHDAGVERGNGTLCYGPIGVGGLKMKIHKGCLKSLFEANHRHLATLEVYELAQHYG
jgi:methylenetetrahydrofolate/methylenetetrahydromethanopterin dehydrogenase (NADP+)